MVSKDYEACLKSLPAQIGLETKPFPGPSLGPHHRHPSPPPSPLTSVHGEGQRLSKPDHQRSKPPEDARYGCLMRLGSIPAASTI